MIWVKDQHAQSQQWLMQAQARAQAQHWIMHAQPQTQVQLQRKRHIGIQYWRSTLTFNIDTARYGSILTWINHDMF